MQKKNKNKIIEAIQDFWEYKVCCRVREVKSWIRFRTWDKHHVIKIKTLKPGWCDKDEILLHAMFQILSNFIEEEKPAEIIDWTGTKESAAAWKEIQFLYNWWNKDRPLRKSQDPLNGVEYPKWKFIKTEKTDENGNPFLQMETVYKSLEHEKMWRQKREESRQWKQRCDKEDTEMMQRLIKIRHSLWT